MSFRSQLARLSPPAGVAAPLGGRGGRGEVLDDLRARMEAVLARTARRAAAPARAVDTPDLPFSTTETPWGPLHARVQRLSAAHRTGHAPLLPARAASPGLLGLLALDPKLVDCAPARALYLDTETTGLHGGTGTVAFLVGLAYWEEGGGGLLVEQLLVRALGEERPMLERVAQRIAEASMLVTFNGKSFDMPLLRTRFVMAGVAAPAEPPHLDLVHVARRLHKPRGVECKLVTIERKILGFERHDDVPSGEVSACYLHFLRTGETRSLLGVVEHNAWDVVAMAALVGLYGEPLGGTQLAAEDLVGVARTLRRAGNLELAQATADRAVSLGAEGGRALPDGLRARAEIARARGDKARALADFEAVLREIDCKKTRLELAKLYEHFVKEPARALALVAEGTSEDAERAARRSARLSRKLEKLTSS